MIGGMICPEREGPFPSEADLVATDGRTVRRPRRAQGRTLKDLAKTAGIPYVQRYRIKRGTRGTSFDVLIRMARAVGLT